MADRKTHRHMTSEEQVRRSEAHHGTGRASASSGPQHATRRRGIAEDAAAASRSEGADAYAARRRKKTRGRILRGVLITLAVALVGVGTAAALYINNINNTLTEGVDESLRTMLSDPVEQQEPFYMLLLGVDRSEGRVAESGGSTTGFRSDTIIIARIDAPSQKVTLVSIPRDTMVQMDGYGTQKINAAYFFGGASYMVEVVEEFAGITISAYAEIDFEEFTSIVDTLGGVEVTLPVDVVDEQYAHINLEAGTHVLDGKTALALVRSRHAYDEYGGGDFYRAANQRMVIGSIIKKILQLDPVNMANVVSELAGSITVYPLSVTDIVSLAMQFQNFDVDTGFYSGQTPTTSELIDELWYEIPIADQWQEMMERVDAGLTPYSDESQDFTAGVAGSIGVSVDGVSSEDGETSSDSDSSADSSSSAELTYSGSVLVLNGTYTSGLAASTATTLESQGFSPYADSADSMDYASTTIYYNGSAESSALGVAAVLGVDESNVSENTVGYSTDYDVIVVLGADQTY